MDIDNFKSINDSYGHDVGDQLLMVVGNRITDCIRVTDKLSRISGDEFNLLLKTVDNTHDASHIAEKIIEQLSQPIVIASHEIKVSVSIGISLLPDDSNDFLTLLKYADLALYHVKSIGKNAYTFFDRNMERFAYAQLQLQQKLKQAIENKRFIVYYQPLVSAKDKKIIAFEALIRWHDEKDGIIMPQEFIPLAESTGLIVPIGEWLIHQVCQDLPSLIKITDKQIRIGINVSAQQLRNENLMNVLVTECQKNNVSPMNLEIEITESMLLDNIDTKRRLLERIRALGVGISIDDFGTGFSNFSYLKQFPVTTLKIDKCFINDICKHSQDREIVAGIIALAHCLNLTVVAEGVETKEQLKILFEKNCDFYQGYLFSQPQPIEKYSVNQLDNLVGISEQPLVNLSLSFKHSRRIITADNISF